MSEPAAPYMFSPSAPWDKDLRSYFSVCFYCAEWNDANGNNHWLLRDIPRVGDLVSFAGEVTEELRGVYRATQVHIGLHTHTDEEYQPHEGIDTVRVLLVRDEGERFWETRWPGGAARP